MISKSVRAPDNMSSIYGNRIEKRICDDPDIVSVKVRDLFPEITPAIYQYGDDLSIIADATREQLAGVNMDMIKPEHTVNICCTEHGFWIMGGDAYVEMLKTIKAVVEERTGNANVRLRLVMYKTPIEGPEAEAHFHLREAFGNKVESTCAFDKGVAIETQIGTMWGIEKVYDADWFIYAYYDDPREMYFNRMYKKGLKAFTMCFARYETRACFHTGFGSTDVSANILPISIFESDFVQSKYAFSCFMRTSPSGIHAIDADNDLYAIDRRAEITTLKDYGLMFHLLRDLQDYTAAWDGERWGYYLHAGGLVFGVVENSGLDPMDLDSPSTAVSEERRQYEGGPMFKAMDHPVGMKALVANQSWVGISLYWVPALLPTFVVGKEQADLYRSDPTNRPFMQFAKEVATLEEGLEAARAVAGTDKLLIFDGSFGQINCSRSMAEELIQKAPAVRDKVINHFYPMYLKQRGIDPATI